MNNITILIADDHTLIRNTWATVLNLQEGFEVVAECATGEEAIKQATALHPKIVLMDINLPGMNGIAATNQIRKFSPGSKVIGVSLHTQPTYARKIMQEGAMGYVTKNSSRREMLKAIEEVLAGKKYVCDEIKNILSEQMLEMKGNKTGIEALSVREIAIITEVKKGLSSKEIAALLNISVKTVEVHRYNILKKLGLKNTAALINFMSQYPDL